MMSRVCRPRPMVSAQIDRRRYAAAQAGAVPRRAEVQLNIRGNVEEARQQCVMYILR